MGTRKTGASLSALPSLCGRGQAMRRGCPATDNRCKYFALRAPLLPPPTRSEAGHNPRPQPALSANTQQGAMRTDGVRLRRVPASGRAIRKSGLGRSSNREETVGLQRCTPDQRPINIGLTQ